MEQGECMKRDEMIAQVRERQKMNEPWDVIVTGGGATGAGVAVDAASRGFSVLLLEREDFAKGTSSRSTKLVHGGVRYLEQGNVSLVMEALKERGILRQNAPHLVHNLPFVVPNYSWWEAPFYGIGLKVYDILAGKYGFGKSKVLSREETLERLPTLRQDGLRGGVVYHDGQFDDSRLLIHLIATAVDNKAVVLNYAPVVELHKDEDGFIDGVVAVDSETSERYSLQARVVVNATGIFTDEIRRLDDSSANTMVAPSQGIHLVLDRSFLVGDTAVMVPHTSDGRVLFAIPWHEHTVVGTTDTPIDQASYEPLPFEQEIEFVLETAGEYLSRPPKREDVLSVYVGIRPLVKAAGSEGGKTSVLSRDHTIHIDQSGLLTIVGGKWTTYRHMAEDTVNHAITLGKLEERPCVTHNLPIHGYLTGVDPHGDLWVYGADADKIREIANGSEELSRQLHPDLPYIAAEVVWAAREEMARSLEDVLARRTRALFLNAHAAIAMAPQVATLLARELNRDQSWADAEVVRFTELAAQYTLNKIADGDPPEHKKD
jgi:glycerol-3-phosphate dehydrogenase